MDKKGFARRLDYRDVAAIAACVDYGVTHLAREQFMVIAMHFRFVISQHRNVAFFTLGCFHAGLVTMLRRLLDRP